VAQESRSGRFLAIAGAILGLGFSLVGSALLGLYLGSLLDKNSPTRVYTPIGLIFGLLVGFHRAWIIVQGIMKKRK
jgi:F0F1-type ATP synthase assembly protein I